MIRLEPRPNPSRTMALASPLLALVITVAIGSLIFLALGKSPVQGLRLFFVQPIASGDAWSEIAIKATPLVLIGLGLAACFRSNVWNIGAEGQYLLGAVFAGGVAMQFAPGATRWAVVAVLVAGAVGGMLWAAIAAFLRTRFHANEILVTLMLVYVADLLLGWLVYGPWKDPQGYNFPQTITFASATRLARLAPGSRAHVGTLVALGAALMVWLLVARTFVGFQWRVGGLSAGAARFAGFASSRALWQVMLLSGGLAGLAGAVEIAGPLGQLTPHVAAGYGFAAIIVAFVGRLHPVGVIGAAILMSMFYIGGELAQSRMGLPKSITGVFQGLLLMALLACDVLIDQRLRWRPKGGSALARPDAALPSAAADEVLARRVARRVDEGSGPSDPARRTAAGGARTAGWFATRAAMVRSVWTGEPGAPAPSEPGAGFEPRSTFGPLAPRSSAPVPLAVPRVVQPGEAGPLRAPQRPARTTPAPARPAQTDGGRGAGPSADLRR